MDRKKLQAVIDRIESLGELRTIKHNTGGNIKDFPLVEVDSLLVFNKSTEQVTIIWKSLADQNKIVDIRIKTTDADPSTQPVSK